MPEPTPNRFLEALNTAWDDARKLAEIAAAGPLAVGRAVISPAISLAQVTGPDGAPGSRDMQGISASLKELGTIGYAGLKVFGDVALDPFRIGAGATIQAMKAGGSPELATPELEQEAWGRAKTAADVLGILAPFGAPSKAISLGKPGPRPPAELPIAGPSTVGQDIAALPGPKVPGAAMAPEEVVKAAPAEKLAGNINLEKINSSDDVKAAIWNIGKQFEGKIDEARRGEITLLATKKMADDMGMSVEQLLARRSGQALNAEEGTAAGQLLISATENVITRARAAIASGDPQAKAVFMEGLGRQLAIQEEVAGATAEAGRALSAYRIMKEGLGQAEAVAKLAKAMGGPAKIDDLLLGVAQLETPGQVSSFLRNATPATFGDKVYFVFINSILSGLPTQVRNITGNAASAINGLVEYGIARGIAKVTGEQGGIAAGETGARVAGALRGAVEGISAGGRALIYGSELGPSKIAEAVKSEPFKSLRGWKGAGLPTRWLSAEDQVFRAIAYRSEINALAIRQAKSEGLVGKAASARMEELAANPTIEMMNSGVKAAEYGTFTKNLGTAGAAFQHFVLSVPGGRYIAPFIRTPANLFKYAGERTGPLSLLSPAVRATLRGANGVAAKQVQQARLVTGSALMLTAADLALSGQITGSGPQDPGERRLWLQDRQPYSVKLGDKWVSFAGIEPFSTVIGGVADAIDTWQKLDASDESMDKQAGEILSSVIEQFRDKTFLTGMVKFLDAALNPEQAGERWVQGLAGAVIPNMVGKITEQRDPFVRETRGIISQVKSKVPGLRETLPLKRSVFGEPIKRETVGPIAVSPFYTKGAKPDEIAREMGRVGYFPPSPQRTLSSLRKGQPAFALSGKQYEKLSELTGKGLRTIFEVVIRSPQYQGLNDEDRREVLKRARDKVAKDARNQLRAIYPELTQ